MDQQLANNCPKRYVSHWGETSYVTATNDDAVTTHDDVTASDDAAANYDAATYNDGSGLSRHASHASNTTPSSFFFHEVPNANHLS